MRILEVIHLYPPKHNCGSEYYLHHVNKYLISRGHQVRVLLMQATMHNVPVPYDIDGVQVMDNPKENLDAYRWADVIISHLDFTKHAMGLAHVLDKPFIHFVHNSHPYESIISSKRVDGVIYNSRWVKEKLNYRWPSIVFEPPTPVDYYNVCEVPFDNPYITLISLNENKGGEIFYQLAKAMPDKKFLGVTGSYDYQLIHQLPNVKIIPNTSEIRDVYKQTRILLMPSRYESWGMTATEAMANGIPVVCTPTDGLVENCADAGIYIPAREKLVDNKPEKEYDISDLVRQIKKLDKKDFYDVVSERCRQRAAELDPAKRLPELERFIVSRKVAKRNNPVIQMI